MLALGWESTAHTLSVGIMRDKKVLANERAVYQAHYAGILPREAAQHHSEKFEPVLKAALKKAKVKLRDVDMFAYAQGPGLGPCLQIGATAAKMLALELDKPLMPVNHCVAHIEITKMLSKMSDPLIVYVSGGNTQIILREKDKYRVMGETLDMGIGNAIDSFARTAGFERAHGAEVAKKALEAKHYIPLPYTVKGMDIAVSGLLTAAERLIGKESIADICHSLQETAFSMLVEATERALALTKKKEVICCGGVASNTRLQQMLSLVAKEHGARFGVATPEFNGDNGAMIAWVGELMAKGGFKAKTEKLGIRQRYRTDEVQLLWD